MVRSVSAWPRGLLGTTRAGSPSLRATGGGAEAMKLNNDADIVSTEWLEGNLGSLKLLDASWYLPVLKRDPREEFKARRIPTAHFFDVDNIKDVSSSLPHMMPPEKAFAAACEAVGIHSSSEHQDDIVVYDGSDNGLFSAARAWFMFKAFGHGPVAVLSGGLKKWQDEKREIDTSEADDTTIDAPVIACRQVQEGSLEQNGTFNARLDKNRVRSKEEVLSRVVKGKEEQLVDARARDRFVGAGEEPVPNSKVGHVPGSFNVPAGSLLQDNGEVKSKEGIKDAFSRSGVDLDSGNTVVTSCGSGMTSCMLALGLHRIGKGNFAVYDGSWREWGTAPDTPVEK